MKHTYILAGMTCNNCMATVKKRLSSHPGVMGVELTLIPQRAVIEMQKHIETSDLQTSLGGGKYKIQAEKQE